MMTAGGAQAAGWYAGGGVGSAAALDADSNVSGARAGLAQLGTSSVTGHDAGSAAASIAGGYEFNRYLSAELAYAYLGRYKLSVFASSGSFTVSGTETDEVSALSLAAVGQFPVYPKFRLIGVFGLARTSDKNSCDLTSATCTTGGATGIHPMFGAGVAMLPVKRLEIRLDYTQYQDVGDVGNDYTAGNFGLVRTSLFYHF